MGFNVERSANKSNWSKIAFIQGNKTSTNTHNYSYVDKSVGQSGNYYYKLKLYEYPKTIVLLSQEIIITN